MDAAVRARWGELFLATHQNNEAAKLFEESLSSTSTTRPRSSGSRRSRPVGSRRRRARSGDARCIEKSPDRASRRYLLLARADLEDGEVADGRRKLDEALEIAQKQKLPVLEIYALKASADLLRGKTDSEWTAKALSAERRATATPTRRRRISM